MTKKDLKPFYAVIQVCPDCKALDVHLNDGHDCNAEAEALRQERIDDYYE